MPAITSMPKRTWRLQGGESIATASAIKWERGSSSEAARASAQEETAKSEVEKVCEPLRKKPTSCAQECRQHDCELDEDVHADREHKVHY